MYDEIMSIDVSIGLPVTSGPEIFKQCIKSIFAQTYSSWELLIILDKVNDEVYELARNIDDSRVKVFYDRETHGLPTRLNQIARFASGKYIVRMDDDDLMSKRRLEVQVKYLNQNQEIDVLGTRSVLVDNNLNVFGRYREPEIPMHFTGFFSSGIFCHPSVVMKKEWALLHPYDKKWNRTEDKELWIRSFPESKFIKINEYMMFIRVPRKLSPKKFHLTQIYDRLLVSFYTSTKKLLWFKIRYIFKSYCKQIIFEMTRLTGGTSIIYRKKYIRTSQGELALFREELKEILATKVPGWD
jgi:glycosyltransferase involved in cell wall biosynthesis